MHWCCGYEKESMFIDNLNRNLRTTERLHTAHNLKDRIEHTLKLLTENICCKLKGTIMQI